MKSYNRKRHASLMMLASNEHLLCRCYATAAKNYSLLGFNNTAMRMDSMYKESKNKYAYYIAMASKERR